MDANDLVLSKILMAGCSPMLPTLEVALIKEEGRAPSLQACQTTLG